MRPLFPLLAYALSAVSAHALDASLLISQYQKQYWQVEQGLPHSYVTALSQAPDGYLLVGTDEGLARFDGMNFRPLPVAPSFNLMRRWISAMRVSRDGSVWIGAFDGQILQWRDGAVRLSLQTGGSVFDLHEERDGVVIASCRNGVFRIERGALRKVPDLGPPLDTSWNVLAGNGGPTVWIVTSKGLFAVRDSASTLEVANGGEAGDVLTVFAAQTGELWIGATAGAYVIRGGKPPVRVPGVDGPVVALLQDRDGTLWAGTWGRGLYRIGRGGADRWASQNGLPDDFIRTLASDNEGNIWIGMRSGGLGRWRQTHVVPFGAAEGLAGNYAATVAADPRGDLWLGTWRGGLYRLDGGVLTPQPLPLPTLYFTVRAMAFDKAGHQWIGNWEGLSGFDGRTYRRYGAVPDSPYHRVSSLLFSQDGALWAGTTDQGVFRFPRGIPEDPPPAPLLPETEVTALLEDTRGTIWAGTAAGLVKINVPGKPESPVTRDRIESILEDSKGRIWASTSAGTIAVVFRDGASKILGRRNGLPEHPLYRILEGGDGSFFVSSPRGIFELNAETVEGVLSGTEAKLAIRTYGQEDGMRTIECHGLSQPAGWRDREGNLWFPTAKGFVRIGPREGPQLAPPRVVIEDAVSESGPLRFGDGQPIELSPGTRNLQIHFSAIRLSSAHSLQFRYRMTGFDPQWVEAGPDRSAPYNELPPGPHTFEVQARDPLGEWSTAVSLRVRQQPRFHQTWWFLALLVFAAAGAGAGAYRWRLHTVRGRYAAVTEERNRIGREWHDTLVAGFSAISLQLEAALASLAGQPGRSAEILEVTRKMVHHYRAEARRVIWDLRDSRPEGETLSMAIRDSLANMTELRGIAGEVTVEGDEKDLPVELRHNLLRICQEAISNAARHAAPTRITVRLVYAPDAVRVAVQDDGRGFEGDIERSMTAGHYGVVVMQERAKRFGGKLKMESRPGEGTTVEAWIPLSRGEGAARA